MSDRLEPQHKRKLLDSPLESRGAVRLMRRLPPDVSIVRETSYAQRGGWAGHLAGAGPEGGDFIGSSVHDSQHTECRGMRTIQRAQAQSQPILELTASSNNPVWTGFKRSGC
jgi:hypothetical protein